MKSGHVLWLLVLVTLLAACGRSTVVRRERVYEPPRHATPARPVTGAHEYVVVRGDTLYGIAFRHGLDYRDVAAWNGIGPPYTIYPGQRIRLAPAGRIAATPPPAARPAPARPPASEPARPAAPPPQQPAPAVAPSPSQTPAPTSAPPVAGGPVRWQWPAQGQIVGRFVAGDPTRQGIDIAGNGGQPVLAAADGVVVYSGAGLVGYGELIIVKHTDEWLSAYGHNRRRLVEEGQAVRAGQQIAEMGRTGASRDMLHFEIRRNGRPVDPLTLLPPR
ncbi:peptidoglycan DD-metalloendopeptidase family protein [Rehaibacterium terrae]|jgi:lipoprotein NlpD|uniref:Lipoprotein NlpD n=1 Tax=Rehaibacterium terrae TaxID=1341696 RepID=A0A7W8DER6_9GAMM|nr:peptidoglycan DD-metalloendopeptidase family protein [Rehaibacterium terrae]MBB5015649.1 lipoprotein NlpD [Rehaibacterium terrae]